MVVVEEKKLTRKDKAPFPREGFPEKLSPVRRRRDPVLYIPGFLRFDFLSTTLRRRLKNLDFEVYTIRLPDLATGDIRKGARKLVGKMEELRVLLGVRRLSLIGQGLGGMIARFAVEQMGAKDYLGRLIMLGTPNHGSVSFYPFFPFKAAREMFPGSSCLAGLNASYSGLCQEDMQLPYVSFYTSRDFAVIPWKSCRLEGAENLRVGWFCTHMGLARSGNIMALLVGMLEGRDAGVEGYKGEEEDALLRELTASLEDEPGDEGDLFRRGKLFLGCGYYSLAVQDLSRLIKLRPDLPEAYMSRGKALRRKINYDENPIYNRAIRDFNEVIRFKPGWGEAYYERGVCYALLDDWSDAVDSWDRALLLNRDLYPAYLARGLGRWRKGDIAGAVEDFTEVLRIQPDEPEASRFLADMGR
jgi:pimeloyl-ACP methyl ester carboxylesterase